MKKIDNKTLVLCAVMLAVILLLTWLLRFDIPYQGKDAGYWTLGDVGVYIAAALLGGPLAAIPAAVGSALADIIAGQAIYAPASLFIKAGMALLFASYLKKGRTVMHLIKAVAMAGIILVLGYFFYDLIFRGDYVMAAIGIPFNILQLIASGLIAVPVLYLMGGETYRRGNGFSTWEDFSPKPKRQLK